MTEIQFPNKIKMPIVLALGFFDSIHKGHRLILNKTILLSESLNCMPIAMTFINNPYSVLNKNTKLVYTYNERKLLLREIGIKAVISTEFNEKFMQIPADDFLKLLYENYNIKYIVCGYDYKFGYKGFGNIKTLENFCSGKGIGLSVIPKASVGEKKISSTLIRNYLQNGEIENANLLLEHPYFIEGKIMHGNKIGSRLLYPTINTEIHNDKLKIADGVYYTNVIIDGKSYKSVTNCGFKPTFNDKKYTVETFIIDFEDNLYGKSLTINFFRRLRDIKKFESVEKLKEQISEDIKQVKSL